MVTDTSNPPLLAVTAVEALQDFTLRLTFDNGEIGLFDMSHFLSRASGVFEPLRQMANFRQAYVAHGTVCWPGNIDLDPELLYQQSTPEQPGTERRIGVAEGCFDVADEDYPRDVQWESMPDVGLEIWPPYSDTFAWATEQAQALHRREAANLDWNKLATEILGIAKSEQREFRVRVSDVMASLAKRNLRVISFGPSMERLLREQRKLVSIQLTNNPSLDGYLSSSEWLSYCWSEAVVALGNAGFSIEELPERNPFERSELV